MENNNPHDNEFYQKAVSLYRKKNYDYAIELFSHALKDNPDFNDCRRYLWDAIRQRNSLKKHPILITLFQKIKISVLDLKFTVLTISQTYAQALELIQKIILLDPNNTSALFKLADIYVKTGQGNSAISALEEIISFDQNNLKALKILADVYYTQKIYEKAKITAIKILKLIPHYLPAENILNDISALNTIEKGFDEMKPAT